MKSKKGIFPWIGIGVAFFVIIFVLMSLFGTVGLVGAIKFISLDWNRLFIFLFIIIGLAIIGKAMRR